MLSIDMLLFFIILIIQARAIEGLVSTEHTVVLAAPGANMIESQVIGGRTGLDIPPSSPGITLQDLTLTNSLMVLGNTLFGKTSVAGGLTIDGTVSLSAQGIQSLGDTLYIEQNKLAAIDIMSGALRVNTDGSVATSGNLDVQGVLGANAIAPITRDLTVDLTRVGSGSAGFGSLLVKGTGGSFVRFDASGSAHFSGTVESSGAGRFAQIVSPLVETAKLLFTSSEQYNSVGHGTLPAGYRTMRILTNAVTPHSRVFLTLISVSTQPVSVTQISPATAQEPGSFTVETAVPAPRDLDFNWFVIN
jgi:hypothetical protein